MIRVALVWTLGKMGLSHQAIFNSHPDIDLVAVCDTTTICSTSWRNTRVKTYSDYRKLLDEPLDAVFVATPSHYHAEMVRAALERGLHVFCEKPFCLDAEGPRAGRMAEENKLVNQVGYHYRFVETFHEIEASARSRVLGQAAPHPRRSLRSGRVAAKGLDLAPRKAKAAAACTIMPAMRLTLRTIWSGTPGGRRHA